MLLGCDNSVDNDTDALTDGYVEKVENDFFEAHLPAKPEFELLPQNEMRYMVSTKECSYLIFQGFINPESKELFRNMSQDDVLTYIADGFKHVSGAIGNDYTYAFGSQMDWKTIEYQYPPQTDAMAAAAWKRLYIKNETIIMVLLSSPERRILDREKQLFLKHWKLK